MPELENQAFIKGPDVLFSDKVPGLPNTPEKIYPLRERKSPKVPEGLCTLAGAIGKTERYATGQNKPPLSVEGIPHPS